MKTFVETVAQLWNGLGTFFRGYFGNVQNATSGPLPYTPRIKFSISTKWTGYNVPHVPHFFKPEEVEGLDAELVAKLDWARGRAGVPFVITSGKRTEEQNATLANSAKDSAHLRGLAVDLRCHDNTDRFKMIQALILAGFKRVGVYAKDGHVHCDIDPSLAQEVFWVEP